MAILTVFRHRFYNNAGEVNAGGKVYTYTAGTSTPVTTYTSSSAAVANANPIILDSKGEADIWVVGQIKVNVLESDDTQVTGWPVDNIGSGVSNNDAQARWSGTAGGTADALTITPSPSITEYVIGQSFIFKAGAADNTTATTIAISGLATIAVQSNGAACSGGEILANKWYLGVLSSTSIMQITKIGRETLAELGAAALAGSTTQVFNVEAATADDHAVSRVFGDARYAALAGSASQAFSALAVNTAKTTVASSATPDIFAVTTGQLIDYTGTATATGFTAAPQAGMFRELYCAGACLFTAGANLLIEGIPSGTTITLAAGALVQVRSITTTQFKMTYSLSGTFTATGTGFTVNPTVTAKYEVENGVVNLSIPLLTGTSNATSFTVTGLPACIASASTKYFNLLLGTDNSVNTIVAGYVNGNVITYGVGINNTTWTAANTKQVFTNEFNYSIA